MIELRNITKQFQLEQKTITAINDLSLTIHQGEIFGVIGESGAGKSTLVRCINLLERPSQGEVIIHGINLMSLNDADLLRQRKKIGMIFQQFNLFPSRTVYENVAFPLKGKSKKNIDEQVKRLLKLVGIEDKSNAYPSQLSGGQKQRVAIARALANEPDVLLCDEATSALDPQTTHSILKLLQDLNQKLNITIVIITHEMAVIKEVCQRVAVLNDGSLVELNDVAKIFSCPVHPVSQAFVSSTNQVNRFLELLNQPNRYFPIEETDLVLKIDFVGDKTKEPIISQICRQYGVDANIIYANIDIVQNTPLGTMIIILSGPALSLQQAKNEMKNKVSLEVITID